MAKENSITKSKDDASSKKKKTEPKEKNINSFSILDKLKSDSLRRIIGFLLIAFSLFTIVSFVSFVYNWEIRVSDVDSLYFENSGKVIIEANNVVYSTNDFTKNETGHLFILNDSIENNNLGGKIGRYISYYLIYKCFGFMSVLLLFIVFVFGIKLSFKYSLLPLNKLIYHSIFWIYFTSTVLGLILNPDTLGGVFDSSLLIYAGSFGYESSYLLKLFFGIVGEIIILSTILLVYMILNNFSTEWLKNIFFMFKKDINSIKTQSYEDDLGKEEKETSSDFEEDDGFEIRRNKIINTNSFKKEKQEESKKDDFSDFEIKRTPEEVKTTTSEENKETPFEITKNEENKEREEIDFEVKTNNEDTDNEYSEENIDNTLDGEEIEANKDNYDNSEALLIKYGPYNPKLDLPNFVFPDSNLLEEHGSNNLKITDEELIEYKNAIINTLRNYGIEITKISATVGPTVTLYEIIPAPGIKISKIKNLEDDIALSLSALGIRIIAPIPGKGTIGIEIPKKNPEIVSMKSLIESDKFKESKFDLPIVIGKTISNENYVVDLAKMPHLLMAGATGQGKSVGLNAVLVSLLYKKHPAEIKFVLVDPKKVELTLYSKIENHYLAKLPDTEDAIITDVRKVVTTLNSLCVEMDNRYNLLKDAQVRNLKEYNFKFTSRKLNPNNGHRFLPYIVLVVDEFADLIMTAGKEVELPIARLAQLARAIGIHLIIATQRPSVNIITGIIKANFPARIAFRVTQKVDSRTILDTSGAEQLIGRGDMLLSMGSDIIRLQCPFVDTPEVEKITQFISKQQGYSEPLMLPEIIDENEPALEFDSSEKDSMFEDCARLVVQTQQGSTSLLQRKFRLGYNRAGRIMDQLERSGIVGGQDGSKPREVLIKDEVRLNEIINSF
ncbi:MAG: hypothetical protein A2X02_07070 [Bacteroidetes bacterium GWF2_29_10]|nr:MAG: hypothetical protein A2X02_07070 [Bacteroidetes bacterium GWF2_29_10]